MAGKRKRRRCKSSAHIAAYQKGIVSSSLRQALEALIIPRLNAARRWFCPTVAETTRRLTGGRASQILARHWINGTRRAPAWFISVLIGELEKQIEHRQRIVAELQAYETGDRRKGPAASARARALMLAGKGGLGKHYRTGELPDAIVGDSSADDAPDQGENI